jgi:hypothetical protein
MKAPVVVTRHCAFPEYMAFVFDEAPLVGNERQEEYEKVFIAIVDALQPADYIGFTCALHLTDLTWHIRRERLVKNEIVRFLHKQKVSQLLNPISDPFVGITEEACRWESDKNARRKIDQQLSASGHSPDSVLAQAFMRGAADIDAVDRRVASYQARFHGILREERRGGKQAHAGELRRN